MKINLIVLFQLVILGITNHVNAQQSQPHIGGRYEFKVATSIYLCNLEGKIIQDDFYSSPTRTIFVIVQETNDDWVIEFLPIKLDKKIDDVPFLFTDSSKTTQSYFRITKSFFNQIAIPIYSLRPTLTAGIANVPFKMRMTEAVPFRFDKTIQIGSVGGFQFRLSRYSKDKYISLLGGVSLSSIDLDSISTNGQFSAETNGKNRSALTFTLGLALQVDNIQLGIIIGQDYINNNAAIDWEFQGNTWISLGFGIALTNQSNTESNRKKVLNSQ